MTTKLLWIAAVGILAGTVVNAQTTPQKVVTDAATALGGKERILSVKTLVVEASGIQPWVGQNPEPDGPLTNWNVPEYRYVVDLANGRMRIEQHRVAAFKYAGVSDARQILALDGDIAFNIETASNSGASEGRSSARITRIGGNAVRERRIDMIDNPIELVRTALDSRSKLSHVRDSGGNTLLDLVTPAQDTFTIGFDKKTGLPAFASWLTSSDNLGDVVRKTEFLEYESVSGIALPRRYLTKIDFRDWVAQDIRVAKNILDGPVGELAAPAAIRGAMPETLQVRVDVVPVAKGIWWLQGSGNHFSTLIEFTDHLTLFEAPNSEARTKAVIDKARSIVPMKPLTEVVVSHHHFDHTGGLRTAVAEGLTVISNQANERFFREVTARKATLRPDLLAKSSKTLKFRGFDDQLELKDSMNDLILYHVKGVVHAPYIIMGWLPREKFLLQGDLIDVSWTQHPWADVYAQNLQARNISFVKDLPVHGRIATREEELAAVAKTKR